jgi:DNA polymerase-3 subunit alpha
MTVMKEVMDQKLEREQAALGFYISKHPIELLKERFPMESEKISNLSAKTGRVSLLVRIQRVKNHTAKTGSMAFLTIDDESGSMNAVVLPNNYLRYQDILAKGNLIYLTGRVDNKGNNLSVVVDKMERILG